MLRGAVVRPAVADRGRGGSARGRRTAGRTSRACGPVFGLPRRVLARLDRAGVPEAEACRNTQMTHGSYGPLTQAAGEAQRGLTAEGPPNRIPVEFEENGLYCIACPGPDPRLGGVACVASS